MACCNKPVKRAAVYGDSKPPDCKTSASKSHCRLCRPGWYNAPFTPSQQKPTTSFLSSSSLLPSLTRALHRVAPPGASLQNRRIIPITFMTKAQPAITVLCHWEIRSSQTLPGYTPWYTHTLTLRGDGSKCRSPPDTPSTPCLLVFL